MSTIAPEFQATRRRRLPEARAALAAARARIVPPPVVDPAHHRATKAFAKTQRRVTTTNPRSTDR